MTRVPLFQRSRRRVKKAPGARPGTLIRAKGAHESRISALCYDAELLQEYEGITASEALAHIGQARVLWIRVQGHADLEALQHLAQALGMHGLALEDVFSLHGQPKLEDYEPGCFFLGRSVSKGEHFVSKQLALFWKQNVLLSFEEDHADAFAPIVRRLRAGKGKIRQLGTDYLAYALIDKVVDDYGPVLDAYELLLEDVEGSVLSGADSEELQHLHSMRRQVTELRRTLRPLRVAVQEAMEGRVGSFDEELRVYLRDTHDHAVQALESCDALRDMLASITGPRVLDAEPEDERHHQGADDHLDDLHSAQFPGGALRHEFRHRADGQHARAAAGLCLPRVAAADGRDRAADADLVLAQGLALAKSLMSPMLV
jgi:magnesium transporter